MTTETEKPEGGEMLTEEQLAVCRTTGVAPEAFTKTLLNDLEAKIETASQVADPNQVAARMGVSPNTHQGG